MVEILLYHLDLWQYNKRILNYLGLIVQPTKCIWAGRSYFDKVAASHFQIPYPLILFSQKLSFFEFVNPKVTVQNVRKLFKGGNYSREETIQWRKLYEEIWQAGSAQS